MPYLVHAYLLTDGNYQGQSQLFGPFRVLEKQSVFRALPKKNPEKIWTLPIFPDHQGPSADKLSDDGKTHRNLSDLFDRPRTTHRIINVAGYVMKNLIQNGVTSCLVSLECLSQGKVLLFNWIQISADNILSNIYINIHDMLLNTIEVVIFSLVWRGQ